MDAPRVAPAGETVAPAPESSPGARLNRKQDVVRDRLLEMVEQLPVGAALPAQRRLAATLQVSRSTLRDVIEDLAVAGYLEPRQGSGTYVSRPSVAKQLGLSSFSEEMRRRGLAPGGRLLSSERVSAGPRLGSRMRLPPQAAVWRLVRLRLADGETMALETAHVPVEVLAGSSPAVVEGGSLYDLIQATHHSGLHHAAQRIQATTLLAEEAGLLGVPEHSAALHLERTAYCEAGHVLEFTSSLYRADRYAVTAELHRKGLWT